MINKTTVRDLSILGGEPSFSEPLHVGCPNIGDRNKLLSRINDILDRRWLTNMGSYSQEFEQRIAEMLGVKHCIAMCNGTIALEIAIRALGMSGEVIVPSMTFVATAHALQWQEITPVFCDIDPRSLNIDPGRIERLITPRTTGIIGVHLWGRPCDIDALRKIAGRCNLKLLFDAAHALGCSYKGSPIGQFGNAEVLSFHATKCLNTCEGGAVVTNDDELAKKIRLMTNFGFTGMDKVGYLGTNGKMNELSAAMGLTSLESLHEFIAVNRRNYYLYLQELGDLPGIVFIPYDEAETNNYHYVVVFIDEVLAGVSRDQLMQILHAENVLARRYFYPGCHQMEPYRSYFPQSSLWLRETEKAAQRVLVLPTGTAVSRGAVRRICQLIRLVIDNAPYVCQKMREGDQTVEQGLQAERVLAQPTHPGTIAL